MPIHSKKKLNVANHIFDTLCRNDGPMMSGLKTWAKQEVNCLNVENAEASMRSSPVDISKFSKLKERYAKAIKEFECVIWTLKTMGFEITPKNLYWHNVMDSCENIQGNIGFFVLTFDFKTPDDMKDHKRIKDALKAILNTI